ncbi:MAG: cytochrome c biogenesis protein CcdA [Frankiales bacterium]|nr:cytochrome c biogenesis protein CcdA [Frankiales bacterium]
METGLLALALVAGAVAAFNPCGFALLPAYLTVLVAQSGSARPADGAGGERSAAVLRALRFSAGMTIGFVAVFGLFGLVLTPLALSLERYLPFVTVVIGIGLIGLGGWLLAGHSLRIPALAGRGQGPTAAWGSQVAYGVGFALASLSCTLAPFLAVTTAAARSGSVASGVLVFVTYAVGMGIVVLVLAVGVATAGASAATRMRRAGPRIMRFSGLLLVVAGAYVAWYGVFEIRVLAGDATSDPVVGAATQIQSAITRAVASVGPLPLVLLGVGVVVIVAAVLARRRQGARS